ncbi:MAG TPA: prolipoprotein diacylglyceryl transferase family protein, partial [Thermoanaerobaculia bacterium]|nr:prolipoprotein diacylglyceryl transferase family protein [Thermoanaerobaculia bacterium]
MFIGFLVGAWITAREFRRLGLDPELVSSIVLAAAVGGIVGGKLYYAILYGDLSLLFSRSGLVWYGGLLGGFLASSAVVLYHRADYLKACDGGAPGIAIAYALGRVGCFLVGDDYGRPTESWVGVAFPKGAPPTTATSLREFGVPIDPTLPGDTLLRVHPTQLSTAGAFFLFFGILMWVSRRGYARGRVFGLFLVFLGVERFLIEIIRAKDDRFFGDFTLAQVISVVLALGGAALMFYSRRRKRAVQPAG